MDNLAGTWQEAAGAVVLRIEGRDPSYSFQSHMMGMHVSQGYIVRRPDGQYEATGQGINGPVRMLFWLVQPGVLHGRAQIDGGMLDNLFASFMPGVATQVFVRQVDPMQVIAEQRAAAEAAAREAEQRAAAARAQQEREIAERAARDAATAKVDSGKNWASATRPSGQARAEERTTHGPKPATDPLEDVQKLIGMAEVKQQLTNLDAWAWRQSQLKAHGRAAEAPSLHMSFSGGPGTGKTTVARIIGRLLAKYELLPHGELKEVSRADLVAEFVGQTASKTEKVIESSLGGVLFIDEAYALTEQGGGGSGHDYGAEALTTLIAWMENHRDELCVIVAGYPAEMERFIDANAGLASRISRRIGFPDYSDDELAQIFAAMVKARELVVAQSTVDDFRAYVGRAKQQVKRRQWGNARSVRNILERGIEHQSVRLRARAGRPGIDDLLRLEPDDFAFLRSSEATIW